MNDETRTKNDTGMVTGGLSRRGFIRTASAGAAGAAALGGAACGSKPVSKDDDWRDINGRMKYVTLGRTGIRASVFLGDRMADEKMYDAALKSGVNYWHKIGHWADPAPYELFRKLDRDAWYCDTTVGSLDKDKAIEIFERSLKKAGLEYIDGFKVHSQYKSGEDVRTKMGAIQAFEQLKKQGKTRYLMMSQHINTAEVFEAAVESDMFDLIQVPVNVTVPLDYFTDVEYVQRKTHDEYLALIKKAADKNIAITAMKVFLGSPKAWDEVPDLRGKLKPYFKSDREIATALIHWSLSVPGVLAFGNLLYSFDELKTNIEAIGGTMTAREREGLRIFAGEVGRYACRMCGTCTGACPDAIPVPDILRYSMYHTGYGEPDKARELYAKLPAHLRVDADGDLDRYNRACRYGLDVAGLLRKAHARLT